MPLRRTRTYLAALAIAALSAGTATATVITYTPSTLVGTWTAALTGPPAYAEADPFFYQNLNNATLNVVGYGQFTAWGSAVGTNDATFTNKLTVNGHALDTAQNPTLNIAAPTGGTNASLLWLGANALGSGQFSSEVLTVTLTDINGNASTFNYTTGSTGPGFFGFTSGIAINTITVSALTGYDVDLMDFYAGTYPADDPSSAPECATFLMLGGGLVVLGARRKFARPMAC